MFLKSGAVFIADAHYQKGVREELLDFLVKLQAPQIFLMGDIFDLLVGGIATTYEENLDLIKAINSLSKRSEVVYLEGNHDFNLQELFPTVAVFPLWKQPLVLQAQHKKVALAHGDNFIGGKYGWYASVIRHPWTIKLLGVTDINGWLYKKIQSYNARKNLCRKMENFSTLACKRASLYESDIVIEGHYHQNTEIACGAKTYINLPSFACTKEVLVYSEKKFRVSKSERLP